MGTQIQRQLNIAGSLLLALLGMGLSMMPSPSVAQQADYFKKYGSTVSIIIKIGASPHPGELRSIDPKVGKIQCFDNTLGGGVTFELSRLEKQQVKSFDYVWPKTTLRALGYAINEQYELITPAVLAEMRGVMYPLLHYLEIPNKYFNIHEQSLAFVKLLITKEQYTEALVLLGTINLNALEKAGYREFSDVALGLVAKVISTNPGFIAPALKLLAKVNVRPTNGEDHQAMLELGDSLRKLRQYTYSIKVYDRLAIIMAPLPASPIKERARLWPIYCYFKVYAAYASRPDPDSQKLARQYLNTARAYLARIDKKPPDRIANEYSLYKLLRALLYLNYARMQERSGATEASEAYYNQSVIEVTEGIVSSRVGLDWLPEALLMAAHGYEKLSAKESAKNVYLQMQAFYKGTQWEAIATKKLGASP
ncbi:MAG: hypothetical protein VCA36_01920 [Opitutales bacterium]